MDLFHCMSTEKFPARETGGSRAVSEERERDPVAPPRGLRRTSLHSSAKKLSVSNGNIRTSPSKDSRAATWSSHYEKKKKSEESLEKILTSRTLSPPPETLPRKFSRSPSVASSSSSGRLPRHPELPPLNVEDVEG